MLVGISLPFLLPQTTTYICSQLPCWVLPVQMELTLLGSCNTKPLVAHTPKQGARTPLKPGSACFPHPLTPIPDSYHQSFPANLLLSYPLQPSRPALQCPAPLLWLMQTPTGPAWPCLLLKEIANCSLGERAYVYAPTSSSTGQHLQWGR